MSATVHLPRSLFTISRGRSTIDVEGETVGECLRGLVDLLPRLEEEIFYVSSADPSAPYARLRSHVKVRANGATLDGEVLRTPVRDGDQLEIRLSRH